jgi:MoaA/NifB/PqqE/SkfB family radical SAM enzyme
MTRPSVEIWLELETRCNLQCKFCYNYWKDGVTAPPPRLPAHEFIEGLSRLFDRVSCERLAISGGEPLLRDDLFEILPAIRDRGIPMVLASNSLLLNDAVIRRLMDAGIVTFQLPLHASLPELHNWLSGMECWRQTISAILALREAGAFVVPVFVATQRNLHQLTPVLELASLLGLDDLIFNRFVPGGLGLRHRELLGVPKDEELVQELRKAERRARELGLQIRQGVPVPLPEELETSPALRQGGCPVGEGQPKWTVDCAGRIRPCNNSGQSIGSIFDDGLDVLVRDLERQTGGHSGRGCCFVTQPGSLVQLRTDLITYPAPLRPTAMAR